MIRLLGLLVEAACSVSVPCAQPEASMCCTGMASHAVFAVLEGAMYSRQPQWLVYVEHLG